MKTKLFFLSALLGVLISCSDDSNHKRKSKSPVKKENQEQNTATDTKNKLDSDAKVDLQDDEKSDVEKLNGCKVNDKYKKVFSLAYLTAKGVLGTKDDESSKLILAVMDLVAGHFNNIQTGTMSTELSSEAADLIDDHISDMSDNEKMGVHLGISTALKALNVKCSEGGLQALDAVSFVVDTIRTIPDELKSDSSKMDVYLDLIMEAIEILN